MAVDLFHDEHEHGIVHYPDVIQLIEDRVHQDRVSMKRVINASLRRGLSEQGEGSPKPYRMKSHPGQLRAGIDASALNRLADELEDAEIINCHNP